MSLFSKISDTAGSIFQSVGQIIEDTEVDIAITEHGEDDNIVYNKIIKL